MIVWVDFDVETGRTVHRKDAPLDRALAELSLPLSAVCALTNLAIDKRVISNYFGNIAFAYEDYGFPYCFSASLFNTGINEPTGYGKETMEKINEEGRLTKSSTGRSEEQRPNIIFVQLESFFDPTEVEWLQLLRRSDPEFEKNVQRIFKRIL